jgi:hypothetical protein
MLTLILVLNQNVHTPKLRDVGLLTSGRYERAVVEKRCPKHVDFELSRPFLFYPINIALWTLRQLLQLGWCAPS